MSIHVRSGSRAFDAMRPVRLTRHYTRYAEGAVLVEYGLTQVLCTVTVLEEVPRFLKGKQQGWLTAEYAMLPRSTQSRTERESVRGKQSGRTQEIQRLIGRSLRAALDLKKLPGYTLVVDCDVLQADGGTRTAAITGSCVALVDALNAMLSQKKIKTNPLQYLIAAVSVGIHQDQVLLDLDYPEDVQALTDMNVVMNEHEAFVEIQGTAEGQPFVLAESTQLLMLAKQGIAELIAYQKHILSS